MPLTPWNLAPTGTQYQDANGTFYKQTPAGRWREWNPNEGWCPVERDPDPAALYHTPTKIGKHRGTTQFQMSAIGGPWDGQLVVFPEPSGSPWGLPFQVGDHYGRYNLSTGEWQDLHEETTP